MTRSRSNRAGVSAWIRPVSLGGMLLWAGLWLNLNTGFWNIQAPQSLGDWQLLVRAILPLVVLPAALIALISPGSKLKLPAFSPSRFLAIYGAVSAIATVFSPSPWQSVYWSVTFLATIAAAWTFCAQRNPVLSARRMLEVTWVVTFVVAAIMAYTARGMVFSTSGSAYGISGELDQLSRSSGVARWAAVPGLVCLLRAYYARRPALIAFFLGSAGAAFFIVYRMQSRGAVFGSLAALLFALIMGNRLRRYALPFLLTAAALLPALESPEIVSDRVSEYLRRGQTPEEFRSMTGRTRAYEHGLTAFWDAPFIGRGHWADRMIIGEHVHNSYLQAMLSAGAVGFIPYLGSWITGWLLFFRLQKKNRSLSPEDRLCVLESGTVMMFFTVRSIPETTTASFAVDLLVMVAVYVYLESLVSTIKHRKVCSPQGSLTVIRNLIPARAQASSNSTFSVLI